MAENVLCKNFRNGLADNMSEKQKEFEKERKRIKKLAQEVLGGLETLKVKLDVEQASIESEQKSAAGIKVIRTARGLNQFQLAKKVGVSQACISQVEKGQRPPTPKLTEKLAKALGVSPEQIVDSEKLKRTRLMDVWSKLTGEQKNTLVEFGEFLIWMKKQ